MVIVDNWELWRKNVHKTKNVALFSHQNVLLKLIVKPNRLSMFISLGMEGLQVHMGPIRIRWGHRNLRALGAHLASGHYPIQQVSNWEADKPNIDKIGIKYRNEKIVKLLAFTKKLCSINLFKISLKKHEFRFRYRFWK